MAISKILHMKECSGGFQGKHLKAAIDYITASEKTQNGRFVSSVNCQTEHAFEQMKETKKKFNKTDKRQAYHIILSFQEDEATPDTVFEITKRFVQEYLADDYEAVFAVHDNTDHPHSHIVFNSVSFRDGKKYHYQKGDWEKYIQPITNRLCEEYGLSTIELDEKAEKKVRNAYQEWNIYRDGKFVWNSMVARDVDACIMQAASYENFICMLEDKGYEVKNTNGEEKYLAVKPQGMKRFVRLKTLGEEYSEERLRQRIYEETLSFYKEKSENVARIVTCRVRWYKRAKLSGLQKKYYAKLYKIGKLKKKAYSVAWKYKDEIKKMQKLQQQYQFLVRHDIHSIVDLALVTDNLTDKRKEVSAIKSKLYRTDKRNKALYEITNEMDELIECEISYKNGDLFFLDEHNRFVLLKQRLKDMGYSYEEVKAIREHYHNEIAKIKSLEQEAAKERKIAESIRTDYIADDGPEYDLKQEQIKEQNLEQEKQPHGYR